MQLNSRDAFGRARQSLVDIEIDAMAEKHDDFNTCLLASKTLRSMQDYGNLSNFPDAGCQQYHICTDIVDVSPEQCRRKHFGF